MILQTAGNAGLHSKGSSVQNNNRNAPALALPRPQTDGHPRAATEVLHASSLVRGLPGGGGDDPARGLLWWGGCPVGGLHGGGGRLAGPEGHLPVARGQQGIQEGGEAGPSVTGADKWTAPNVGKGSRVSISSNRQSAQCSQSQLPTKWLTCPGENPGWSGSPSL